MRKMFFALIFAIVAYPTFAQEAEEEEEQKEGWTKEGSFSLLFSQAAFNNNWTSGGTSNYSGNLNVDYGMHYKQDRFTWDNTLLGEYGLTKNKGEKFSRKTNDRLELNSIAGYQVAEDSKWSYSFFANFKTQFGKGYNYDDDNGLRKESTRFMSPGYLKFGPGMMFKEGDLLQLNIAPATARFVFVDGMFTDPNNDLYQEEYYGMKNYKTSRFEFGASIDATSKITLADNVDLKQKISLFSDYLDNPQNIDIDYTLKLDMKINEFLSANFTFQAIYEDKVVKAFQIREALGVGFSYKL